MVTMNTSNTINSVPWYEVRSSRFGVGQFATRLAADLWNSLSTGREEPRRGSTCLRIKSRFWEVDKLDHVYAGPKWNFCTR